MRMRRIVGVIGLSGLAVGLLGCGGSSTRTGGPDAVLKMVPADCLFCARVNDLERTLGELDQYLAGVAPTAVGPTAKTQLGELLGNSSLAGVKLDGVFAVFGSAPDAAQGPDALMRGLALLIPVSDYDLFKASSPKLSQPDAQGVSSLDGTPFFAAKVGGFVLMSPTTDAGAFAARAKSLTAAPAATLAGVLDPDERARATGASLWIHTNIQAVAKLVGPGLGEKIRSAAAGAAPTQAGPIPGPAPKAFLDLYAGLVDALLRETRSVEITIEPKPAMLSFGLTVAALPGTSLADLLAKSRPSSLKDSSLLGYAEDGAMMTGVSSFDPASLTRFSQMGLDLIFAAGGTKPSETDEGRLRALMADSIAALGGEMAFSLNVTSPAMSLYSATYVFDLREPDKWLQLFDKAADLMNAPFFRGLFDSTGMTMDFKVQHAAGTYQGVSIDSAKATFTFEGLDPTQAQMMQDLYNNLEYRMATVGRHGLMAIGKDADAMIRRLIDLAKAGRARPAGAEIKAALEAFPEARNADLLATYNLVRLLGMGQAMMTGSLPAESFESTSNMILAFSLGEGKASFRMALPRAHLTEIVRAAKPLAGR